MKIVITDELIRYLRKLPLSVQDMRKRGGISEAAIYRVLRGESGFLSERNTSALAKAVGLSEDDLLRIANPQRNELRESSAPYGKSPPGELRELNEAWPLLCPAQKARILGYVQAILDDQKMEERQLDKKTA